MSELALVDWLQERLDNSRRIAATKTGDDRNGWLEDALYFTEAIDRIADLEARLAASEKEVERLKDELSNRPFTSEMVALRNEVKCLKEETRHLWDYNNQRQAKIEALEHGVSECEGLLRRVRPWVHIDHLDLIADIDAYFERRKP